jgi:hypothetical protein
MVVFTDLLAIEGSFVVKAFWKESDKAGGSERGMDSLEDKLE